jgi:hypothetical protein
MAPTAGPYTLPEWTPDTFKLPIQEDGHGKVVGYQEVPGFRAGVFAVYQVPGDISFTLFHGPSKTIITRLATEERCRNLAADLSNLRLCLETADRNVMIAGTPDGEEAMKLIRRYADSGWGE